MPWSSFFECLVLSQLFHSTLLPSSRGSLVPLCFLPLEWYLRLLIFLLAVLIPDCDSFSLAFSKMYSPYKLSKQGDNVQPCHTLFPIWNQFIVPCPGSNCYFLTCIEVSQDTVKVVWYFHLFKNFLQFVVIYRIKGFSVVNEAGSRCFSGIPLLSLWSNEYWQFDLWFLRLGLPSGTSGKESVCWCKRPCRFDPWIRRIPWSRKWQPVPVFLPGRIPWTENPGGLPSMG